MECTGKNCQWFELSKTQQEQLKGMNDEITEQRNSKYLWFFSTVFAIAFGLLMFGIMIYNLKQG